MEVKKAKIGNALTSSAANHVVAVSEDIYDESKGRYQSDINEDAVKAKIVADKAAADVGVDSTTLLQGGIDSDGKENVSSYYLRTSRFSTFKLEVNDGYTIGQIAQYDLAGNFVSLYNDYTQSLEGVEWNPTSVVATDKEYMWVAVVFKGNSPTTTISPREAVVKSFASGLYYYMEGGESDPQSAAQQARQIVNKTIQQLPNEEDLTLVDGKMQMANRAAAVKDGKVANLGYVILRPDKSFVEQVTEPNCIYEIRYEFDLQGGTVGIKDNCILKFNGGKITNGNLNNIGYVRNGSFGNITINSFASNVKSILCSDYGVNSTSDGHFNASIINKALNAGISIDVDNGKNSPIVCDTSIVITRSGAVTIKGNGYLNFPNSNGLVFGAGVSISDALIDGITIKSKGYCIDFSNNDGEEYPAFVYRSVFSNLKLISDTDCVYGGYKKNNDVLTFDLYFQNIRVKTPANAFRAISGSLRNRVENITGEVFGSYFYDFLPEKISDSNMTYPAYNDSNTLESAKYLIYLSKRFDEIKAQMSVEIRNCNIEDFQNGVIGSDKNEWDSSYDSDFYLGVYFHKVTITGGKMTAEYDNIISYPYAYFEVHLPFASTKSKIFIDAIKILTPRCVNYTLNDLNTSSGFTIPATFGVNDGYSEVLLTKSCSQLDLARINTLIQVTPQIITDADYDSSIYGFYVYKSNVHLKLANRTSFANFILTIKYGDKTYPTDAVLPFIVTNMGENTITDSANRWSLKKGESGIFAFLSNGQYLQYHCITTVTKIQENNKLKSGTTSGRPTGISTGFLFFDTTLSKPIWWTGEKWVDSTGAEI